VLVSLLVLLIAVETTRAVAAVVGARRAGAILAALDGVTARQRLIQAQQANIAEHVGQRPTLDGGRVRLASDIHAVDTEIVSLEEYR